MSKQLIIDPGHGGLDSGAIGVSALEKEWNLEMSLYQYKRLIELGAFVSLTRNSDVTLEPIQRISRIKNQYDLCVSNHFNAFNGEARGIEVIHSIHAKPDFAIELADGLIKATGLPLRRVFTRVIKPGVDYYFMNRMTGNTETVIIEYGFIDNERDSAYFSDKENFVKAAESVVEVICKKLGVAYKTPGKKTAQPIEVKGSYKGKRVESIHAGNLRFYNKPSWNDADVFGYLAKGVGFNEILDKVKVGSSEQYKVRNTKGDIYYVTTSPTYVKVF